MKDAERLRVIIIGNRGEGKTYLAREIAKVFSRGDIMHHLTTRIEEVDPNYHNFAADGPIRSVFMGPTPAHVVIETVLGDSETKRVVVLNEFQTIESRIMSSEEARKRACTMYLGTSLVEWIVKHFEDVSDNLDQDRFGPRAGENGRIAWGQSHEAVYEKLALQMGVTSENWDHHVENEDSPLNRVWNSFFEE